MCPGTYKSNAKSFKVGYTNYPAFFSICWLGFSPEEEQRRCKVLKTTMASTL